MEIIQPLYTSLAHSGTPTYTASLWVTSTVYAVDDVARKLISGSYYDFRCRYAHTSAAALAPPYEFFWERIGPSAIRAVTGAYTTSVCASHCPAWASGSELSAGMSVFDSYDNSDYLVLRDLTVGVNTIRPSVAVVSTTATEADRFQLIGAANAWACLDYASDSYTYGYNASGAVTDIEFTFSVYCATAVDRLFFAGLINVSALTVTVTDDGAARAPITVSLEPTGVGYDTLLKTANIPIDTVAAGSTLSVAVELVTSDASKPARLALAGAGLANVLSATEWGVETGILSFSRKSRDDTFGTVAFIKRGSSRQITATGVIDPAVIAGDVVLDILAQYDGAPVFWDFNGGGTSYDRLRTFGFFASARRTIQAASWEALSLTVEGLVE